MWLIVSLLAALGYAAIWLLLRKSAGIDGSLVLVAQSIGGLPILAWSAWTYDFPWNDPNWIAFVISSFCVIPFIFWILTKAAQQVDVSVINPLFGLSSVCALVLSVILYGKTFPVWGIVGVLVTSFGLFLLYHGRWNIWKMWQPWATLGCVLFFGISAVLAGKALEVFPHPFAISSLFLSGAFIPGIIRLTLKPAYITMLRTRWSVLLAIFLANTAQEIATAFSFTLAPVPYALSVKRLSIILASVGGYYLLRERHQSIGRLLLATILVCGGVVVLLFAH